MKKLLILVATSLMISCQDATSDAGISAIELSANELTFDYKPNSQTVKLSSNGNWQLENPCDWISVNPEYGTYGDNDIEITVYENLSEEILSQTLIFTTGDAQDTIYIEQGAFLSAE